MYNNSALGGNLSFILENKAGTVISYNQHPMHILNAQHTHLDHITTDYIKEQTTFIQHVHHVCKYDSHHNHHVHTSYAVVGEVPTKRSSDHDPMIRHCRIIGRFET